MLSRNVAIAVTLLSFVAGPAFADTIATVAGFSGNPTVNGKPVSASTSINEHDKITVGLGNVQLIFTDGTKLVIGENSSLVIEKYLMKGGNQAQAVAVDALRGTFRFITGNSAKSAYNIQTANATIGIRGTGFDFYVAGETGVVVMDGSVRLCKKGGGGNKCVDIPSGCNAGVAAPASARKLRSFDLAQRINNHLPYIIDQNPLKTPFHLNTASCDNVLTLVNPGAAGTPDVKQRRTCQGEGCG